MGGRRGGNPGGMGRDSPAGPEDGPDGRGSVGDGGDSPHDRHPGAQGYSGAGPLRRVDEAPDASPGYGSPGSCDDGRRTDVRPGDGGRRDHPAGPGAAAFSPGADADHSLTGCLPRGGGGHPPVCSPGSQWLRAPVDPFGGSDPPHRHGGIVVAEASAVGGFRPGGSCMRYGAVLFDLDGTLIDTNGLILASYEHTLNKHCPGKYSREEIVACLGEPLYDTMRRLDPEQWEAMVQTYREHNLACHDDWVKLFPGVSEV